MHWPQCRAMARRPRAESVVSPAELAVRLHDAAAGLGLGVGLFRSATSSGRRDRPPGTDQALAIVAEVQADLKQLSRGISEGSARQRRPIDVRQALCREAKLLSISLELEVVGELVWLAPSEAELVWLASREALRNVGRHSGVAACRISLSLASCPFVLRARDWGAGVQPMAHVGSGIARLRELAEWMGCKLSIASQPGLGTELLLTGPPCARERRLPADVEATRLRSEVEEKTP